MTAAPKTAVRYRLNFGLSLSLIKKSDFQDIHSKILEENESQATANMMCQVIPIKLLH